MVLTVADGVPANPAPQGFHSDATIGVFAGRPAVVTRGGFGLVVGGLLGLDGPQSGVVHHGRAARKDDN